MGKLPVIDSLWDYNNPAETEQKFNELLPEVEKPGNESYRAELLTQIARTYGLRMKFDESHKILDKAEALISDNMQLAKVRYMLERGRTFNSSKVYDKASDLFFEAYKLAVKYKLDFYIVDAAHMMGIVEKKEESLKWNEIAMKHAEESDVKRAKNWLGALYNNTGWTYHDMGEYQKALDLFEKNVLWHTERNTKRGLIIAKWCVGRALRSLGRIEEAFEKQAALKKEIDIKQFEEDGYVFEELGECLLLLNREDEAKKFFKIAYELLSKDIWLAENEKERLERLKQLGGKKKSK